ncbi:cyclopropane-fatty-acyl-phospholipid synthase family protein [Candidatus Uabimicrobium sp. HlEnr_7]|uniref:SAM-dependent methyltransferase n=1 Tax=Candidatus Uabimicrobium helgolandensis TaxID=3095367 RepID=UPI0035573A99
MAGSYSKAMDEIYGHKLAEIGDKIPSRHFGYYPPEQPEVSIPEAQERYIRHITRHIKKGSYILDLGCAFGETAVWLVENLDCRVLGIDIVNAQIEQAKAFAKKKGLEGRLEYQTLDACKMDFPENTFDYIVSLGVLVHVPEKDKVFKNAFKSLKTGGGIAFSDPIMGEKCSWIAKQIATQITFNVSYMKKVSEYKTLMQEVGFENIETEDVTEISWIKTWELSKKEKYNTVLEPFKYENYFWAKPAFLNMAWIFAKPCLKKRSWGWYFFWAEKK